MRSLLRKAYANQRTPSQAEAATNILWLEERLNNPQPSVIRGHCRGRATLFSFVVEDAAPPTRMAWSIMDR